MTYSKESFDRIFGQGIFLLFRRFANTPSKYHQSSSRISHSYWINKTRAKFLYFACGAIYSLLIGTGFDGAKAQDSVLDPGDAVVTGFSGLTNVPKPNPLDGFFIDPQGPSLQVFPIGVTSEPNGQLLDNKAKFFVKAADVGQVFAITFERPADALPLTVPNIFVAASSTFGLQLVLPDTDGDGHPERTKTGHPDAQWMAGQFGDALGGTPGSIYRIDGVTGEVSLFANILGNSGVGLGDIVFDQRTRQLFVSDSDT